MQTIVRNQRITIQTAIRLFPLIFLIHDAEELILVHGWMVRHSEQLHERFGALASFTWTTPSFAAVMSVLFALAWTVSAAAARSGSSGRARKLFLLALAVLFVNVFTHVGQTLLLQQYTPGVATAVAVAFPYCLYVCFRLYREGWHS